MPANIRLDIYSAGIKKPDYEAVQNIANIDPALIDLPAINASIKEMVEAPLAFAEEMVTFAEKLLTQGVGANPEIEARNALSRAYYCVHHAGRALLSSITKEETHMVIRIQ